MELLISELTGLATQYGGMFKIVHYGDRGIYSATISLSGAGIKKKYTTKVGLEPCLNMLLILVNTEIKS